MNELLDLALLAAKAAGAAILKHYEKYEITYKSDHSPLTSADLAANEVIFKILEKSNIPVCSEEQILDFKFRDFNSKFWLIDPLDGTKEFIAKNGQFCVCIALIEFGRPVLGVIYAPCTDEIFYSVGEGKVYKNGEQISTKPNSKNIISGNSSYSKRNELIATKFGLNIIKCGSAIKFCRLAEGGASVYARFCASCLWDTGAGEFLLEQSGGVMVSLNDFKPLNYAKSETKNDYFLALNSSQAPNLDEYLKFIKPLIKL